MNMNAETLRYSVLPRVGVAAGFLLFSACVLMVSGRMPGPDRGLTGAFQDVGAQLIVTPREFQPAFESWQDWSHARGESFMILGLDAAEPPFTSTGPGDERLSPLGALCVRRGVTTLLIAGGEFSGGGPEPGVGDRLTAQSPSGPVLRLDHELAARLPGPGLRVYRAPIRSLDEAWAFVNDCRSRAATFGDLILESQPGAGREIVWSATEPLPPPTRRGALLLQAALDLRP